MRTIDDQAFGLRDQARARREANDLRACIEAVLSRTAEKFLITSRDQFDDWMTWAVECAAEIDPTVVASIDATPTGPSAI
jgi:hypothetical protein